MGRFLRGATLLVVVGTLIAGCGSPPQSRRPSAPAAAPSTLPASSTPAATPAAPGATPSATPVPASSPNPTPAPATVYRCLTADLNLSLGRAFGAAGQSSQYYLLTNTSGHACGLIGYPGLQMRDADGAALATRVSRWGTKWPTVILQPGGIASFEVIWQNGFGYATPPPSCAFPARMDVIPPNAFTSLAVTVQGMEVCSNGLLEVSSVVAGANPEAYLPG